MYNSRTVIGAVRLTLLFMLATVSLSVGASPGSVTVVGAWSRATAPGASVGVVYFEIHNSGAADQLIAIETPLAQRVEMHSTTMVGGVMQMRPTPVVDVPTGGRIQFSPGGLHAMLIDLKQPLKEGERVPLTLVFRHSGGVHVEASIEGLDTLRPSAGDTARPSVEYRLPRWPQPAKSPELRLLDNDGRPRSLADYRGRVVVVFFGFVRCPDVCPAELFKLALVMKKLGPMAQRVQVLFITLDPERDTPSVLKNYVAAFDPRFVGLTGTPAQIDRAASSFFVQYARVASGGDYSIDHSTGIFVFDTAGRLSLLGATDASADDIAHDLTALAAQ